MNDKTRGSVPPVPRELRLLRGATSAYLSVLKDSVPALTALKEAVRATGVVDDWLNALQVAVRTCLLDEETAGTVASIAQALAHLLGEEADR